jgi:exosome complex exonuclease DIS3/RRP44
VYMVERRIDMLPKPLTEDICSLRADVERLAFSVLWEMTAEAEIVSVSFTKSIIKSSAALSYVEAQARMDDSRLEDALTADLRNMNRLAKIMRQRRIERGALTLASPEVKFEIDTETHDPLDVGMYQVREANQMVEEFMLAANISVAEKILKHFPAYSLLRRHPVPTPSMFEPLLRTAAAVGVHLDISSSKALADSLDHAVGDDPYFNKLIRILATRCMTQVGWKICYLL